MNLSDNAKNRPFKFRTKIEPEKAIIQLENKVLVIKSNLKLKWEGQVYVTTIFHTHLLKEL